MLSVRYTADEYVQSIVSAEPVCMSFTEWKNRGVKVDECFGNIGTKEHDDNFHMYGTKSCKKTNMESYLSREYSFGDSIENRDVPYPIEIVDLNYIESIDDLVNDHLEDCHKLFMPDDTSNFLADPLMEIQLDRTIKCEIKTDYSIFLEMTKRCAIILNESRWIFGGDYNIVLAAVTQNGLALEYADERLQKDKNIVLAAVAQNGLALAFSKIWRDNEKIVLTAITQNGLALQYCSTNVSGNRYQIMIKSEKDQAPKEIKYYRDDHSMVLRAVTQNGLALKYAGIELKKDREIVIKAYFQNKASIEYADTYLRTQILTNMEFISDKHAPSLNHTRKSPLGAFNPMLLFIFFE